eukprot:GEMP01000917.1.p1 GENE.GEMP01000917.1~~GEMP01000917.1.p1  ORF type:complete len:768 (+),score=195.06 GEMP01000917.1:1931-4234(+)
MSTLDQKDAHDERAKFFENFISKSLIYQEKLKAQYNNALETHKGVVRLHVNIPDLEAAQDGLSWQVLMNPGEYLPAFEEGVVSWAQNGEAGFEKFQKNVLPIRIAFTGAAGRHHVTPRGLTATMVTKLVVVEGIVTRTGDSKPKCMLSIHHCAPTGETRTREHVDPCALMHQELIGGDIPQLDDNGNRFDTELGLGYYKDVQNFTIQEMPENAPSGQIPRSVDVRCDQDLVDTIKPGARVRVTGMYKAFPQVDQKGVTNGCFPCRIIANNIQLLSEDVNRTIVTAADIRACKQIAARDDTIELLTRSFAPSICGNETVKKGLLLLMAGGSEKNLPNGTHLRGDINVLLVGDPSCGKSQMLRFVMNTAKLCISTTGRGSSGVGLTAAVNIDRRTGERRLDAGAMVLADRGIVCIDEFDKMGVNDRVSIHEVMEQQTVTIAKAGIHTTLNARCSVLAAANPIYSNFDDTLPLAKNINLPDSMLSRFDLIYVMRDLLTVDQDRKIAAQVLRQARYCPQDGAGEQNEADEFHDPIYERQENENYEVAKQMSEKIFERKKFTTDEIITVDFLKKYLTVISKREVPQLSKDACRDIGAAYADLRQRVKNSPNRGNELSVTTRSLESMIRLATALAKLKMRDEVTVEDVRLTRELIFQTRGYSTDPEAVDHPMQHSLDHVLGDSEDGTFKASPEEAARLSASRLEEFQILVAEVYASRGIYVMTRDDLFKEIRAMHQEKPGMRVFTDEELALGCKELIDHNKLCEDGDEMFLVA